MSFSPELRFSTYTSHRTTLVLHHFALHCTCLAPLCIASHCLTVPLSLPVTPHLETIPYPQIAPLGATQDLYLDLWLHRFLLYPRHIIRHISHTTIKHAITSGQIMGIDLDINSKPEFCEPCAKAKSTHQPFPKKLDT